jgi:hypothetical protein
MTAGGLPLEDRYDNYYLELPRHLLHPLDSRSGNRLGKIEALVLLGLAEVRRVEQLLKADDLRAAFGRLTDAHDRPLDVLVYVVRDRFLDNSDCECRRGGHE